MPTRRAQVRRAGRHITSQAAEAFIAGDGLALRRALGLRPWQFTSSPTADEAKSAEQIMAHREQIEAELNDWERE